MHHFQDSIRDNHARGGIKGVGAARGAMGVAAARSVELAEHRLENIIIWGVLGL